MKTSCSQCGTLVHSTNIYCPKCQSVQGLSSLAGVAPYFKFKNQKLAATLGMLLGGLGIHKFYLRQYRLGSLYLVFCWTLIPIFMGWIDGVKTLRMNSLSFVDKYCY